MNNNIGSPYPSNMQGPSCCGQQYANMAGQPSPYYQPGLPLGPLYGQGPAGAAVPQQQIPGGMPRATGTAPITPLTQPFPVTVGSLQFFNGYLRTQIGNKVTVDFLIGSDTYQDRTGTLLSVGANYIVLNEVETDDILICDFYSIKFVTVYH